MPLYEYSCPDCGVTERLNPPSVGVIDCPECGQDAPRLISRPVVRTDLTPYDDDGLGIRVESRQQRARFMKHHGLEEKGTTEMSGAKGTIYSHPGRATESVPKSGAQLGKRRVP